MKLTPNGVRLFIAIELARREKRKQVCDTPSLDAGITPKMLPLEGLLKEFPMDEAGITRLKELTGRLGEKKINRKVIAMFFGGEEYAALRSNDLLGKGFCNSMLWSLLLFGTLLPIKITKERSGSFKGQYVSDNGAVVEFTNIWSLCRQSIIVGRMYFLWYGYVLDACPKEISEALIEDQSDSVPLSDATTRVGAINLKKIFSPEHVLKKK